MGTAEQIAGELLGVLGGLKPPKSMIVGTALLVILTIGSAYITYKELEKENRRSE